MPAFAINIYKPQDYLRYFTSDAGALPQLLTAAAEQFFIVLVERLYPLFKQALPPARATAYTCLYLTSGTATMHIGAETHTIRAHEVLLVRADLNPLGRWSFDLDDCDRVLRLESNTGNARPVIDLLMRNGFRCEELV
ncbi:hypothetical protein GCM10027346_40590 [Hymenobacter seoulensis]